MGCCKTNFLPVFSLTNFNNFLAIPCFLKMGFTKIYSISAFKLNLTNPIVVLEFLNVKTPSYFTNLHSVKIFFILIKNIIMHKQLLKPVKL